mgnify:CR=1 FL=1
MPMNALDVIRFDLQEAAEGLNRLIGSPEVLENISRAADLIVEAQKAGGKVLSCGNGGSLCDAMHFAEELTGRFRHERAALPAIAIADPSHFTCVSNDMSFDSVFSKYLEALGNRGDVLLAISTSGNSSNILQAIDTAHVKGMKVIGLTGKTGGKMKEVYKFDLYEQKRSFVVIDKVKGTPKTYPRKAGTPTKTPL